MKKLKQIIFIIPILFKASSAFAQVEHLKVKYNVNNKKTFFQGEVFVLDAIVKNNNNSVDVLICNENYSLTIYSPTYGKDARELESLAPADYPRYGISTTLDDKRGNQQKAKDTGGCSTNWPGLVAFKGDSIHYSLPITLCLDNNMGCNGGTKFILPVGKYEVTFKVTPSTGGLIFKTYSFEMIPATPKQSELLKQFKVAFRTFKSKDIIQFYESCDDISIRNKVITSIYTRLIDKDIFTFWLSTIPKITDEALLYYNLNRFIYLCGQNDEGLKKFGSTRLEAYALIITGLKNRDAKFTHAFLTAIKSWNRNEITNEGFSKIPDESINALFK